MLKMKKHLKKPVVKSTSEINWTALHALALKKAQEVKIEEADPRLQLLNARLDPESVLRKLSILSLQDIKREFGS